MELLLRWRGPVGPGRFPGSEAALEAIAGAGVYLRVKRYAGGRTVSYVGQSRRLLGRFDQHIRDILTFSSALRDDAGTVALARAAVSRLAAYNALDDVLPLVAAEARRLRFYWASCADGFDEAYLTLAEGALKGRLEDAAAGAEAGLLCENRQGIAEADFDDDIVIVHDFDALDGTDRALLVEITGGDAIRLPARLAELGHAG
jgi:hypothetical protein